MIFIFLIKPRAVFVDILCTRVRDVVNVGFRNPLQSSTKIVASAMVYVLTVVPVVEYIGGITMLGIVLG